MNYNKSLINRIFEIKETLKEKDKIILEKIIEEYNYQYIRYNELIEELEEFKKREKVYRELTKKVITQREKIKKLKEEIKTLKNKIESQNTEVKTSQSSVLIEDIIKRIRGGTNE